jgi:hypothetical protein
MPPAALICTCMNSASLRTWRACVTRPPASTSIIQVVRP